MCHPTNFNSMLELANNNGLSMGRLLMAVLLLSPLASDAEPQITEFVAINADSLTDGDGNTPDWIEIHNPDSEPLDLSGYRLTDDVEVPDRYTFPNGTLIPGGGYLIVFASGQSEKDYRDAEGFLHTNFSLDGDGEYLALHAPDGTLIQAFEPAFDPQFEDVSYGVGTATARSVVVPADASGHWWVPNEDIGNAWQLPDFDEASWTAATTAIGYGHTEGLGEGGDTRNAMWFVNASVYLRLPFEIEDPSTITSLELNMRFDDGFVAYLNGTRVAAASAPEEDPLAFDATATAERADELVNTPESYAIPANTLTSGTNILAIHGLNFSSSGANSADFLIAPELTAVTTDAGSVFGFFTEPTPGEANGPTPLLGFVADTKFSQDRGYYSEPFDLTISSETEGATIYYTTDGTPPSPDNGTVYSAPISIDSTTTLRAFATKESFQSTNIDTQTYLFVDDIVEQRRPAGYPSAWGGGRADYDMDPDIVDDPAYADAFDEAFAAVPTLSLVFDPDALFDRNRGIYQRPDGEGISWERPVSAEFMVPDDSEPGFHINAGIRIQGGSSRNVDTPKHAFSLRFRAAYGAEKLRYPLFENTPVGHTAINRFDVLQLRPEYNFGWMHRHWYQACYALYGRDQWASDLFNAMGQNGSHGRWVHLFLNGIYWGLYDLHERPDANHMANYFGGEDDDYDTVNSSVATNGDLAAFNRMMNLAYGDIQTPETYAEIQGFLNIDAFIDYMILNAYVGNRDWDGHNWRAARRREEGSGYLFFPWDTEFSASHVRGGVFDPPPDFFTTALATNVTDNNGNRRPTGLQQRLERNAEYRLHYGDHVHAHFFNDGPLTPEKAAAMWTARSEAIEKAIVAESARWGDFRRDVSPGRWPRERFDLYTRDDHYLPILTWLLETYIPQRSGIVLEQLRSRDLYPNVAAPKFSQHGGTVPYGFELGFDGPGAVHFTRDGSDPRLLGGGISADGETILPGSMLTLTESAHLKARSRSIFGEWSALTEASFTVGVDGLAISEIMYHPKDTPRAEFVELHNRGDVPIALTGLRFTNGISFDFDSHGSIPSLAPDARLLIVRNVEAFRAVHGDTHDAIIAGVFQEGTALANGGETLTLSDANDAIVQTVTYDNGDPWPTSADGEGRSLILNGNRWIASGTLNGSPGQADAAPIEILSAPLELTRVNEVMTLTYHTTLAASALTIQQSSDLQDWKEIETPTVSEQVDGDLRSVTVELPNNTNGFVRVRAMIEN